MWIYGRENTFRRSAGDLARALEEIPHPWNVALCTDDIDPDDLLQRGHIDRGLRVLIEKGVDPALAVRFATLNGATSLWPARPWRAGARQAGRHCAGGVAAQSARQGGAVGRAGGRPRRRADGHDRGPRRAAAGEQRTYRAALAVDLLPAPPRRQRRRIAEDPRYRPEPHDQDRRGDAAFPQRPMPVPAAQRACAAERGAPARANAPALAGDPARPAAALWRAGHQRRPR